MASERSFLSRAVDGFLRSNLSVLLIIVALAAGVAALLVTPREEEPQIVVPLADVIVSYPGGGAEEVERLVSARLERMLYQIDGVEYVYSMSRPGLAVVTVRFFVGENREDSLIKLYNKIQQNQDQVTPGIAGWVVKPVEIDDVPVVAATLFSERHDTHELYRVAEEVKARLQHITDSARISLHGGERRAVHVYLDPERLAAYGLSAMEVAGAVRMSNVQLQAGRFEQANRTVLVEAGPFLGDAGEVRELMVGTHQERPVYLRDVADVVDGPEEKTTYSRFGFGPGAGPEAPAALRGDSAPAVTIAVAKKRGTNAVRVAREMQAALDGLRGSVIPDEIGVHITRDYGATANDKVNNLVKSLGQAIVTVIALITVAMGLRAGLIVALAVPLTYSLTLLVNYLAGYTINRVTLFALILALGLLVDDPIVGVENICRHLRRCRGNRLDAVSAAMNEVLPPIVLSTLTIIVSFVPMFFITGMMGPYMRPMALNVPLAILISTGVSIAITPWLSFRMLKEGTPGHVEPEEAPAPTAAYARYRRIITPFLDSRRNAWILLAAIAVLFAGSVALALSGRVPLKTLPFDNKNEFQILLDLPEAATLETTDAAVRDIEEYLRGLPEVTDFTAWTGLASPMDFNGMVRHYYLREGPHVGEVRVNLLHRDRRRQNSHAITLRIRRDLDALAARHGARLKVVEVPPGPPVLSTVVAEVYGGPHHTYDDLTAAARAVEARMAAEPGVVDVDTSVEDEQSRLFFRVDREKAGMNGVSAGDVARTLRLALDGETVDTVHAPTEQNELPIVFRLPRGLRSDPARLAAMVVKGRGGAMVQVGELGAFEEQTADRTIFHKNLERVVYVTAEMAGRGPAYAVLAMQKHFRENPPPPGIRLNWRGEGEWKITVDVFRDLGLAFSAALVGIFVLLVYETRSYLLPLVIMLAIPLSLIGIMPGFWLLNGLVNRPVGGFADPVFFTATAMIGMIALSGIVVRNAIILIDFIRAEWSRGTPLREAIVSCGAVRFRPIFLTASTTVLGAWPITLDPIFSGLAWSIIFGMVVSTSFTLVVVPTVYHLIYRRPEGGKGDPP